MSLRLSLLPARAAGLAAASAKTYLPVAGRPLILRTLDRIFATSAMFEMSCWSLAAADIERLSKRS